MNKIEQRNFREYNGLYHNPFEERAFEVLSKTKIFEKILRRNGITLHNKKILEIGFGSGNLIPMIIKGGGIYYGLEISNSSIVSCREKYGSRVSVTFIKGGKVNYGDRQFDIIIMSHSLEHMKSEDGILKEAVRVLNEHGFLIIGVPSENSEDNYLHFRTYSKNDAYRIGKKYKLKLRDLDGVNSVRVIESLLSKLKQGKECEEGNLIKQVTFLRRIYYVLISPIFSEIYSRNLGRGKINEWWYVFEK